jgi:hypothetical protein
VRAESEALAQNVGKTNRLEHGWQTSVYFASSRFEALTVMRARARPLDLPLSTPIATAQATLTTAPLVLVDGQTDAASSAGAKRQGRVDRTATLMGRPTHLSSPANAPRTFARTFAHLS